MEASKKPSEHSTTGAKILQPPYKLVVRIWKILASISKVFRTGVIHPTHKAGVKIKYRGRRGGKHEANMRTDISYIGGEDNG